MCTPALANYGSEALKQEFLVPSISGDVVGCLVSANRDRALMWPLSKPSPPKMAMITSSEVENVDHQRNASRLDVLLGQHL